MTRAVGKHRAMELIMTGRFLSASEAMGAGLVSRVVSREQFLAEALKLAQDIARKPPLAVRAAKEAINKALELSLSDGLDYERKLFYMLFATSDQKEGMKAFIEKRKPKFVGR